MFVGKEEPSKTDREVFSGLQMEEEDDGAQMSLNVHKFERKKKDKANKTEN